MEQLLVTLGRHLLIVLADFALAKVLHYVWSRVVAAPTDPAG